MRGCTSCRRGAATAPTTEPGCGEYASPAAAGKVRLRRTVASRRSLTRSRVRVRARRCAGSSGVASRRHPWDEGKHVLDFLQAKLGEHGRALVALGVDPPLRLVERAPEQVDRLFGEAKS